MSGMIRESVCRYTQTAAMQTQRTGSRGHSYHGTR